MPESQVHCLTEGRSMTNRRMAFGRHTARKVTTLVVAISGALVGGYSWADDAAVPPSLAEVIVTAQKRSENIQDVPISVIALSSQQLKDSGVSDIKNLTVLTPGLTVTSTTIRKLHDRTYPGHRHGR